MRSLAALLGGLGMLVGIGTGVAAHQGVARVQGWTFYTPPSGYADYLPAAHPPWLPGIIEYAALGLGAGLVAATALIVLRFRLVRVP